MFSVKKEKINEAIDWIRIQVDRGTVYDYSLSESTLEDVYVKLTANKRGGQ